MKIGSGGVARNKSEVDPGPECRRVREEVLRFINGQRGCDAEVLISRIESVARTGDLLTLELTRMLHAVGGVEDNDLEEYASTTDWIRQAAGASSGEARRLQAVGSHLGEMPLTEQALMEGRVSFGHLVHMAHNASFAARSRSGHFDERPLLAHAEAESVNCFYHTCQRARHVEDPEGVAAVEAEAVERRSLTINQSQDGTNTTWFNVCLDNPAAALTQSVLEQLAERLGPDDKRDRERRMADAFVELTQRPLQEVDGNQPVGKRVQINVTCTMESLLNLPGASGAEVEFGDPISSKALGRLACEARVCKILLDDKLQPVAVGRMKRTLTPRERRALNARDHHCRWPGCTRPPMRCDGHHLVWYSRGGPTLLENMVLLCARHHWMVHEGNWQIALDGEGQVHVVAPSVFNRTRGPAGALTL